MFTTRLKSITRHLTRTAVATGLAGATALALVAVPGEAGAAPTRGCISSRSCITDVTFTPGGQSLAASVTTVVPTWVDLSIYLGDVLVATAEDYNPLTSHSLVTVGELRPNTTYRWDLFVGDDHSQPVRRGGLVTTQHRVVTVHFDQVKVLNDSDPYDAGEFRTFVSVPSAAVVPPLTPVSIESGETKPMGAVLQQFDAERTTRVRTEMWENDYPLPGADTFPTIAQATWDSGQTWDAQWLTVGLTLDTKAATTAPVAFHAYDIQYGVGFAIYGTYTVSFVS